ncbi:MAG TPA: pyridoxal 5'-phosphate synthase glutaminase subunit PdxT [Methanomicrobiales archaeon]|nr:pyridoxal 5'-phosphate synthase glutaminase subunit PdxT [Methanomicrobiales archaeon]
MGVKVGVLALQGDVSEHIHAFRQALLAMGREAGSTVFELRRPAQIPGCDAIAFPGGESTTISRLIDKNGMRDPLESFEGGIFATCAGMVLMAREVDDPRVQPLRRMDITVMRNAFGRQKESFEADLDVKGLDLPYHAIFIRAPVATEVGPSAETLAAIDQGAVAVRQGRHMAFSFHPEIGGDLRLHLLFLQDLLEG